MREYWDVVFTEDLVDVGYARVVGPDDLVILSGKRGEIRKGKEKGKVPVVVAGEVKQLREAAWAGDVVVYVRTRVDVHTARIMKEKGCYALLTLAELKKSLGRTVKNIQVLEKMGVEVLLGTGAEKKWDVRAPREVVSAFVEMGMGRVNAVTGLSKRWEEVWDRYCRV